jgi:hypothetical protein
MVRACSSRTRASASTAGEGSRSELGEHAQCLTLPENGLLPLEVGRPLVTSISHKCHRMACAC